MKYLNRYAVRAIIGVFLLAIVVLIIGSTAEMANAKDAGIPVLEWFDSGLVEKVLKQPYGFGE